MSKVISPQPKFKRASAVKGAARWYFRKSTKELVFELQLEVVGAMSGLHRYASRTVLGVLRQAKRYGGDLVRDMAKYTQPVAKPAKVKKRKAAKSESALRTDQAAEYRRATTEGVEPFGARSAFDVRGAFDEEDDDMTDMHGQDS